MTLLISVSRDVGKNGVVEDARRVETREEKPLKRSPEVEEEAG